MAARALQRRLAVPLEDAILQTTKSLVCNDVPYKSFKVRTFPFSWRSRLFTVHMGNGLLWELIQFKFPSNFTQSKLCRYSCVYVEKGGGLSFSCPYTHTALFLSDFCPLFVQLFNKILTTYNYSKSTITFHKLLHV